MIGGVICSGRSFAFLYDILPVMVILPGFICYGMQHREWVRFTQYQLSMVLVFVRLTRL